MARIQSRRYVAGDWPQSRLVGEEAAAAVDVQASRCRVFQPHDRRRRSLLPGCCGRQRLRVRPGHGNRHAKMETAARSAVRSRSTATACTLSVAAVNCIALRLPMASCSAGPTRPSRTRSLLAALKRPAYRAAWSATSPYV